LRQRDQQRGLGQGEPLRLLAEVGKRSRANTLEIAAERRHREIEIEDLLLAQLPLDLDGADDLTQLGIKRAMMSRLFHQPRQLHGDGRSARDDMATRNELPGGACQCDRVDAGMVVKALVFEGEQQLQVGRIDVLLGIDRQPPAAVLHREGAQELAVAVDDGDGGLPCLFERQRPERGDPCGEGGDQQQADRDRGRRCSPDPPPVRRRYCRFIAHFAGRTSTVPVALRP
jgi:hypothetical protein